MHIMQSRRDFLASASVAAAARVLGTGRAALADEGPPEVTTIRLRTSPSICLAPRYLAGDLLRAEGFTDVQYIPLPFDAVARGDADFDFQTAQWIASQVDAGARYWPASMSAATSCSRMSPSEPSAI
jgi:NitT/TauT family transport system substrate-binding protein